MAFALYTLTQKSADQIRQDFLRVVSNGLIGQGVATPNVGPGSDYYLQGQGIGNELAVVHANTVITADALMPDTATGSNLDRWLAIEGLSRRAATGSAGNISAPCSVASPVTVAGTSQLTDTSGLRFQATAGIYTATNGYLSIAVTAVDTGSATNHNNADPLKWVTAPPFCGPTALVGALGGSDGLTGGNDSEVGLDEPPRARLLSQMANPPKGGNAADIASWATQSSPVVQAAFVYPALLGPGTAFFVATQQPQTVAPFSSTSKTRAIPGSTMTGTVVPFVRGLVPTYASVTGTTSVDVPADIAILLNLPSAPTASPPGSGGGWLDGTPWPSSLGSAPVTVSSVGSPGLTFTVNATSAPTPGVSHVAFLSPANWQLYTATVLTVTGTSGAYIITVDTPLTGITAGSVIWPQCVNQQTYVNAALSAFAGLGTGEWTPTGGAVYARAFRHPQPTLAWPNALGATFLKQIINTGPEVLDANWISRPVGPPAVPGTITLDANNNLTSTAPGIYVPRQIGFYAV